MIMFALRLEEDAAVRVSPEVRHRVSAVAATWEQFETTAAARTRTGLTCGMGNYDILGKYKYIHRIIGCMGICM